MGLLKIAALGAAGFAAYQVYLRAKGGAHDSPAAFASGQGTAGAAAPVRDAGPDAMRDGARRPWTPVDQQSDESFPASDPPGNY